MNSERLSNDFLELASEQRLEILTHLNQNQLNIAKLAKLLGATNPEVHRNVGRLSKNGLIVKNPEGNYQLTTFGKTILSIIPSLDFISDNRKFFNEHNLDDINTKFIQRLGSLNEKKQVKGFVKVLEKWKKIQENADEFIYNILSEVPYSNDIIEVISDKLKNKIPIKSIFSKEVIIPEDRKKMFEEKGFQKFVTDGILERKISDQKVIGLLVTDKEAGVFFPKDDGEPDLSVMFFSTNPEFREWCLDYFEESWKNSPIFQESKLK